MNTNPFLTSCLTGNSPYTPDDFTRAVAERFLVIKDRPEFAPRLGGCYDGNRTDPQNLGWRCAQNAGFEPSPAEVLAGDYDDQIVAGYHEAAEAEHYYRYEKDWGY